MDKDSDAKSALVPRLRFPEFREAGEWEAKPLGAIARISQGGTPSTSVPEYWGGSVQWLTPAEMGKEVNPYISKTTRSITDVGLRNCSSELLPPDSVILSTRAPIGHLAINSVPMAINQGCRGIVVQTDSNAKFVYYSLGHCRTRLESLGAGNTFKELSGSALKSFAFPIPPKNEQQKIADCLSSLDELITAQTHKLDILKTHKKGLMQHLFPRDGETVPRLRFPEFLDAGEWEVRELGCLCKIRTGKKDVNEGSENGLYPFFTCAERHIYCNTYSFDAEAILISGNANVGQTKYYKGKFEAYQRTYVLTNFAQVSVPYLYLYLSAKLSDSLAKQVQTSAMSYIKLPMLETYKVPSPKESREQQKIADCLSSLDELITAQTHKLDILKAHKKGLMQQLFPVLDEVSA